jgi:hypothetical protein
VQENELFYFNPAFGRQAHFLHVKHFLPKGDDLSQDITLAHSSKKQPFFFNFKIKNASFRRRLSFRSPFAGCQQALPAGTATKSLEGFRSPFGVVL